MINEELILERLDRIESRLAPLAESVQVIDEFRKDVAPLTNHAVQVLINELQDVESSFQLEDFLVMVKRMLRSTRDITYALDQLENIIDFVKTLEPLLKNSIPP